MKYDKNFTTEELCAYLYYKYPMLNIYFNMFITNHINGESFLNINNAILNEMGIKKVGHKLKILGLSRKNKN